MVFGVLLDHVRAPARDPAAGERRHERPRLQAQGLKHERRKKLDVGSAGCVPALRHRALSAPFARPHALIEQLAILERRRAHCVGDGAEHCGARITRLVDAVPKTHDAPARRQLGAHPRLGPVGGFECP